MDKILIVEDDLTFSQSLSSFLERHYFEVIVSNKIVDGAKQLKTNVFDLILLDYRLPDGTGLDLVKVLQTAGKRIPVIIMTSFNDVRTAVTSIKMGVFDYIIKPVNPDHLMMVIKDALKIDSRKNINKPDDETRFISGTSEQSRKLDKHIKLVAPTNMSVILQGESGTGKEHLARKIHQLSKRANKAFVAIDCGSLSSELAASELFGHIKGAFTGAISDKKGLFELASGGTLFLDEVGNLSYEIQVKLLRALQEKVIMPVGGSTTRQVDVRIIAATNDDLGKSVKNQQFRTDLYHRLNEFSIIVPPLHKRGDDIQLFIRHFIELSNEELGKSVKHVSNEAMKILLGYDWPGNLRELKNTIKRAVLLTSDDVIEKEALPEEMVFESKLYLNNDYNLKSLQETTERDLIVKTLQQTGNNKSQAARLLNIDRKTLYKKISKYNIEE
jgi:two-component system response regulator HydG